MENKIFNQKKRVIAEETIKSVTKCPTCNSEVTVEGITTHYYVPIAKYTENDVKELCLDAFKQGVTFSHKEFSDNAYNRFRTWFSQNIKSLNK